MYKINLILCLFLASPLCSFANIKVVEESTTEVVLQTIEVTIKSSLCEKVHPTGFRWPAIKVQACRVELNEFLSLLPEGGAIVSAHKKLGSNSNVTLDPHLMGEITDAVYIYNLPENDIFKRIDQEEVFQFQIKYKGPAL